MAKGKKTGGKNYKPGQPSSNPGGRPKLDPEIKKLRALTKEQFKEIANLLLTGTQEDLDHLLSLPQTSMLTQWMCKSILIGAATGDYKKLDDLLNRLIGKVKDEIDHTVRPVKIIHFTDGSGFRIGNPEEGE